MKDQPPGASDSSNESRTPGPRQVLTSTARRVGRRVRTDSRLGRLFRPTVSVILPIYNVERYLRQCLDSIAAQTFQYYELIVVDDGSPDGSRAIAEEYAAQDHRIRILTRPNGGLGAARNTGIRAARGRFLTFADSDDALPPHALESMVSTARDTGSDIVVGAVGRFDSESEWRPDWVTQVHSERRTGIVLTDFMPLLRNLYTWNKLFRRDFWEAQGLWFREGVAYEDQPIITQLYVRAKAIDVIPEVTYSYRAREDMSSISQQTATVADLRARILAWEVSREVLRSEAPRTVYDAWLQTLLDSHLHWYLNSTGVEDQEYWELIRAAVVDFTDAAPQALWDGTPPIRRVALELARQGRRDEMRGMLWLERDNDNEARSEPRPDGVLLHLPLRGDPRLHDELFLLRPAQLTLEHSLEHIHWETSDAGHLTCRLSGWAYIGRIDLAENESSVSVVLRSQSTGEEHAYPATGRPAPEYPPPAENTWCDYSPGTFELELPVEDALRTGRPGEIWSVLLRVESCGFTVTSPVTRLIRRGSAGGLTAGLLSNGARAIPEWRLFEPLSLRHVPRGAEATEVQLRARELTGRLDGPRAGEVRVVVATAGRTSVSARTTDRRFRLELPPPAEFTRNGRAPWQIAGRLADGTTLGLVSRDQSEITDPDGTLVVEPDALGELGATDWRLAAIAETAQVTEAEGVSLLRVTGRVHGARPDTVALRSTNKRATVDGPEVALDGQHFHAELRLEKEVFRFGSWPLCMGNHDLEVLFRTGAEEPVRVPLRVSRGLSSELPIHVDTPAHEGTLVRGPDSVVRVTLVRPLRKDRGPNRQRVLQQKAPSSLTPGVLFRSYFGELATDNGVAIQQELRRRGSDLDVFWAVQDHSVVVPDGAIPVIVGSAQWHALLGSVAYYVDNMYQPGFHRKPDGQVLVQTFHGYPFKQMGHAHWRNLGFPQARIDSYDERARQWDFVVSPARYATPLLARDFAYDGEMLEIGYPRNDVLQSPEAGSIRKQTRESLGIEEHQTAVLYAPTFRDYLAVRDNRAVMPDFFDFARAHRRLGDDFVLLIRGHAFNARTKDRLGGLAGCVDVTDYPEISDLYLAADAAVVDYSSLRFDFGVTGKPMIFHVPDLERYQDTRGWLFDFEPTAPGPLVSTTDQVVDHLLDLAGVRARHAAAYQAFHDDFLDLDDGAAARRFVDAVLVPRGDAPPA